MLADELQLWRDSDDSLGQLVDALERNGTPPLKWVVAMQDDDTSIDPAIVAWRQSTNPRGMLYFLYRVCGSVIAAQGSDAVAHVGIVSWTRWRGYNVPYFEADWVENHSCGKSHYIEKSEVLVAACDAIRSRFPHGFELQTVIDSWNLP